MNGIENITARIMAEAEEYVRSVESRAEEQLRSIIAEADAEIQKKCAEIEESGRAECAAIIERALSSSAVLNKTILLDAKGKALDRTFELAQERLSSVDGERYFAFLSNALDKAIDRLGAPEDDGFGYEVSDPDTYTLILNGAELERYGSKLCTGAEEKVRAMGCTLRAVAGLDESERGFILRRGEAEINSTLSLILKTARPSLEAKVYRILFPASPLFEKSFGK